MSMRKNLSQDFLDKLSMDCYNDIGYLKTGEKEI